MDGVRAGRTSGERATEHIAVVLEHSPYPPGRGSDVYCCGTCGVILALRAAGAVLGHRTVTCWNCATCNEGEARTTVSLSTTRSLIR